MTLETPLWLNSDFVGKILQKSEKIDSIQVIDISWKPAAAKGDNYTSDLYRVTVEFSRHWGNRKMVEKRSLIFKVEPSGNGPQSKMLVEGGLFGTEISILTDTLTKMNEILGSANPLGPRVLYTQESPFLLVMEDLLTRGFRMGKRTIGLDLDHCSLAIKGIARFHASSIALCEKEPKYTKMYNKGIFHEDFPSTMKKLLADGTRNLGKEVATWPECGPRYSEKILKFADVSFEKGCEMVKPREDEFKVINHGDCWVNNMLFRYNDEGKPIEHIFVDFQLCFYASPAIDLLYFLCTSPSQEVRERERDILLEEYQRTLSSTMTQLGCKTVPPSMESLKKILKDRMAYEMLTSFMILPLIVVEQSNVKSINEMLDMGEFNDLAYKNQRYREIVSKRLPEYERMGLLDL